MKKILVTGGSGFIGQHLLLNLIKDNNYEVFNLDKKTYASKWKNFQDKEPDNNYNLFQVDLKNKSKVSEVINTINPDIIFHLAAETHVDNSIDSPKDFINSNIIGTFNLLEAIHYNLRNTINVRKNNFKFIHVSTDEVFGSLGEENNFNEGSPYRPRSPYSASKASSDHLVKAWHHTYKLPTIITNCSNNYGAWQHKEKFIPKIIINSLLGKTIPIYGNGNNIRDWIYVDDHVNALIKIMKNSEIGTRYCIGAKNEISNTKLAIKICNILDKKFPKKESYVDQIRFVEDRKGHDFRYALNVQKIRNELGWEATTSFKEGLEKTIDWYSKNISFFRKTKK
tara:strand:- start:36 stop:1052 length:1017 start_codon:yes stop_codon:yes gene_type:complete